MNTFTCSGCSTTKPLSEFNRNRRRKNGHDNRCRECMKGAARAREAARRGEYRTSPEAPLDRQCSVEGCPRRTKGHGYCSKHLQRYKSHGDPLGGGAFRSVLTESDWRPEGLSVEESFRWFMPGSPPSEGVHWTWRGPRDANGYGCFTVNGKRMYAHRVSYELFVGPIPDGLVVRHKNDTPLDVNPSNLETGTRVDNRQDCIERERVRSPQGVEHGHHILTESDVVEIRRAYASGDTTYPKLAARYGVSSTAIAKVVRRTNWRHVM